MKSIVRANLQKTAVRRLLVQLRVFEVEVDGLPRQRQGAGRAGEQRVAAVEGVRLAQQGGIQVEDLVEGNVGIVERAAGGARTRVRAGEDVEGPAEEEVAAEGEVGGLY